jgi:hypothetical protein
LLELKGYPNSANQAGLNQVALPDNAGINTETGEQCNFDTPGGW